MDKILGGTNFMLQHLGCGQFLGPQPRAKLQISLDAASWTVTRLQQLLHM